MRDAVEPRAQRHLAVVGAQRAVGAHEDVLQRVLGVLARAGQHLAHVGEQPLAVAVVDDAERLVVAGAEQRHQLLVGAQPQQRRPERRLGSVPVLTVLGERRLPRVTLSRAL